MTPRDELRELLAARGVVDDNTGVRWIDEPTLLASLPAGGGDERWTVTVDAAGELRGIGDKTDSVPPTVADRAGLRVIEVIEAPPSSAAGDEAREALISALLSDRVCDALLDELVVAAGGERGFTSDRCQLARWDMKAALRTVIEKEGLCGTS